MTQKETETDRSSRFGWCMDGHHETCVTAFLSDQTKKNYQCACSCHQKESDPGQKG